MTSSYLSRLLPIVAVGLAAVVFPIASQAHPAAHVALASAPPSLLAMVGGAGGGPQQAQSTVQLFVLVTILSVAPALLIMTTAFTRIIIVLSFARMGLGAQTIVPNQVLYGLAVLLTFFVMAPTYRDINSVALQPYLTGKMAQNQAITAAEVPLSHFMVRQTYTNDLDLFLSLSNTPKPRGVGDVPFVVLMPAFVISELKTGFLFGFLVYLPFVVIDLVVSSVLMTLGMVMVPPASVSLPAKVLVFVLADGWHALANSLAQSYR
jgi:flagellar biosynthetic protein FliP